MARRWHGFIVVAVLAAFATGVVAGCGGGPKKPKKKPIILTTQYDDARAGDDAAKQVEAQMGLYNDPALTTYVKQIGTKLVRYAPLTSFKYQFRIVDQPEPNAFALPGGHIYVSRGLLALTNNEHELANVLGHEVTHSAARHSAAQQAIASRSSPLAMPHIRMAKLAAYGRDQERDADQGGQFLASNAGYDPMGMSTFLRKLGNVERQKIGYARLAGYFDTHPGSSERAATTANRAHGSQAQRTQGRKTGDRAYLKRIEGLVLGVNPSEGVFQGNVFVHPDLGFHVRFPTGWRTINTHQFVGASSARGHAFIFLEVAGEGNNAQEGAQKFIEDHGEEYGMEVERQGPVKTGSLDAWRVEGTGWMQGQKVDALLTFIPFRGLIYRLTAVAPPGHADKFTGRSHATLRSFGAITQEERNRIEVVTLHVVAAQDGETLPELRQRTNNAFNDQDTAILNGVFTDVRFREGEWVKVARTQPYRTKARGSAPRS